MSLVSEFAKVAARLPRKVALITDKSQLTFEDILQMVQVLDIELTNRGIRSGQAVALASARAEFVIAFALLASWRSLTAVFVGNTPNATQDAGLTVATTLVETATATLPAETQTVIEPEWFAPLGTLRLAAFHSLERSDAAYVFRSSGTTGRPKFVRSTDEGRVVTVSRVWKFLQGGIEGRRCMTSLSPATGSGFSNNLSFLLGGASAVSLGGTDASILPTIDLHHVDLLATTPAMIAKMLAVPGASEYLGGLRDVRFGGAVSGRELLVAFSRMCPARLHVSYGAAETGTCLVAEWSPDRAEEEGFVGRLVDEMVEAAFFDDDLNPLPDANQGLVGFRLNIAGSGRSYLSAQQDGSTGFHQGYFIPGDYMRRVGDEFFLIGRAKNIINYGGNKFSLESIQTVLERMFPGFQIAPLLDVGSDALERVALVCRGPHTPAAQEFQSALDLSGRFPALEVSQVFAIDEMPMTPTSKIDIQNLRARFGLRGR